MIEKRHNNRASYGRRTQGAVALALAGLTGGALTLPAADARACGCFAPPDPSVPIVQAGERIVFSHADGKVTAHIQIQYQGTAQDFGWLLPLPSVPTMRLGVEELFTQIVNQTQPKYRLTQITGDTCEFGVGGGRGGAFPAAEDSSNGQGPDENVVVLQDSVGPYDYAVLRGDSRDEMFDWLADNRYFVPQGTEDVVAPYIYDGAYFLALKLKKGNDVGDLQPVIVEYDSDLPMIPIVLTSVAANPDMGIQVWVLGEARAIPRNYRHTVINEEYIDWFNAGANYNDVIIKAVDEAKDHQSFVTEYAGTTDIMKDLLDYPGRFGARQELERTTEAGAYVGLLRGRGFPWTTTLVSALKASFPFPDRVRDAGITEDQYYDQLEYYLTYYRQSYPEQFEGVSFEFDAVALTAQLWERIVEPTLEAGRLFKDNSKMTRMYTTLSPEEMTKDPVFSFNPTLPDVSNVHEATLTFLCSFFQDGPANTPAILKLPGDGREIYLENQAAWANRDLTGIPASRRIELLREEGEPEIELDNSSRISGGEGGGCACTSERSSGSAGGALASGLLALGLGAVVSSRRRRSRA